MGGGSSTVARLCQELQRAADADRQRLARALHDSASQTLSAAAMSLSVVERETALSPRARRALADAQALLTGCCRELQDMSQALHPPLLSDAGLAVALRGLARRLGGRLQLEVDAAVDSGPRLAAPVELAAFRFVEEALTLFDDGAAVTARLSPDRGGSGLAIVLAGAAPPAAGADADAHVDVAALALRHRVRGSGGRLRERRAPRRLVLHGRFPR
jgi:signal transduction histidine kinase